MNRQIAFVSYETPFAPSGGLAPVVGRLPQAIAHASGLRTRIITPYHHKIEKTTCLDDRLTCLGRFNLPLEQKTVAFDVLALEPTHEWIFLRAQDTEFFAGERHPYDVSNSGEGANTRLLQDALLFGSAVVRSLALIDPGACWTLLLQEWEAATTTLALTALESGLIGQCFLTLHNSYDCGLTNAELARYGINPDHCPGQTVLQRALPLVHKPIFTVSSQFARDLTGEILEAEVMAPHLQHLLGTNLAGVDNGIFTECSVDPRALAAGCKGDYSLLQAWKKFNRAQAARSLGAIIPSPAKPVWGDLSRFLAGDIPWFVMAGRDDSRQKGYDVAAAAVAQFLEGGGQARFLFLPIPGDEGLAGLGFLQRLAQRFPDAILVLPFMFREGYATALQGATYGILPSFYEPFGMANEYSLKGTLPIGRATGGIIEQIIPSKRAASYSPAVAVRSQAVHENAARPIGLLFREPDTTSSAKDDWHAINNAGYAKFGDGPDRVEQRMQLPLFRAMVSELNTALCDATLLYTRSPELYFRMLIDGVDFIQNRFTWERAANVYAEWINRKNLSAHEKI